MWEVVLVAKIMLPEDIALNLKCNSLGVHSFHYRIPEHCEAIAMNMRHHYVLASKGQPMEEEMYTNN